MRTGTTVYKSLAAVGAGAFLISMFTANPARSAERAVAAVSDQSIVVDRETLHKMVHDEVARQLQDFFAQVHREQVQRQAMARLQSVATMAGVLRSQLALYKLQHNDRVPSVEQIGDGFKFLTHSTNAAGEFSNAADAIPAYMQHPVANPLTGKTHVAPAGKATANDGWSYDPDTLSVKAVLPAQLKARLKDQFSPRNMEFAAAE